MKSELKGPFWGGNSRWGYSSIKGSEDEKLGKATLTLFFFPWSWEERNGNSIENVTCIIDLLNNVWQVDMSDEGFKRLWWHHQSNFRPGLRRAMLTRLQKWPATGADVPHPESSMLTFCYILEVWTCTFSAWWTLLSSRHSGFGNAQL